jgi:hypothetical protein
MNTDGRFFLGSEVCAVVYDLWNGNVVWCRGLLKWTTGRLLHGLCCVGTVGKDKGVVTYRIHGSTGLQPSELVDGQSNRRDVRADLGVGKHGMDVRERRVTRVILVVRVEEDFVRKRRVSK